MTTSNGPFATGWRLALIAAAAVGSVVAVARATAPAIARNEQAAFVADLAELTGIDVAFEDLPADVTATVTLCAADVPVTVSRHTVRGYGGDIELLVARSRQTLRGVRVARHQETPGIGDVIDRDRSIWIDGFAGIDGRVDAVTGATITTRAVIEGVASAASTPLDPAPDCEP